MNLLEMMLAAALSVLLALGWAHAAGQLFGIARRFSDEQQFDQRALLMVKRLEYAASQTDFGSGKGVNFPRGQSRSGLWMPRLCRHSSSCWVHFFVRRGRLMRQYWPTGLARESVSGVTALTVQYIVRLPSGRMALKSAPLHWLAPYVCGALVRLTLQGKTQQAKRVLILSFSMRHGAQNEA